jgi:glycosyltransferase involved in cell wall biosynthesis
MPSPTITVCVPTYNGAAFLGQTLACIAAQTFDDYEVIIVDDQSSDDTLAIAEAYAAKDACVRVVRNSERAGSSARNANQCLRHARGEWIKFLFQDDLMAPTCLTRMLEAGRRGPLVVSWHDYLFAPDVGDDVRRYYETLPSLARELPTEYADVDAFSDAVLKHWVTNFIGPTSSSFIHRECFARYGEFSSEIWSFPDLEYWIRVGNNEGLSILQERLVTFRVHTTSISSRIRSESATPDKLQLEWLLMWLNLARAPEYANIRSRALRRRPPMDPEQVIRDLARDTRWHVGEISYRTRNKAQREQWDAFCARHPAMRDVLRDVDASMSPWGRFKQYVKRRL